VTRTALPPPEYIIGHLTLANGIKFSLSQSKTFLIQTDYVQAPIHSLSKYTGAMTGDVSIPPVLVPMLRRRRFLLAVT
jgi:hypothetical protein